MRGFAVDPTIPFVAAPRESAFAPNPQPSSIHARLRAETLALHRQVEGELDFLLDASLSLERYRWLIEAFYGFYRPLEIELVLRGPMVPPPCFALPARHELLRRDLVALGATARAIDLLPLCAVLPPLASTAERAGSLYVLEGAALGGRVIARALVRRAGMGKVNGAAFFTGEGEDTPVRWKSVLAWLEEVGCIERAGDELVHAARETFRALGNWIRAREGSRCR